MHGRIAAALIAMTITTHTPDAKAQAVSPIATQSVAKTQKPPLYGSHWMAITGKPLAATAGAMVFQQGGNAVDAACAMIAATSTMWDTLSWGGETQALVYDPRTKKVIAINGLGVAPSGATPEFYRSKGYAFPPAHGPLAALTPGTPGGLMLMLSEYGRLSLAEVLAPAIQLADGYPIDAETADKIEQWKGDCDFVVLAGRGGQVRLGAGGCGGGVYAEHYRSPVGHAAARSDGGGEFGTGGDGGGGRNRAADQLSATLGD